MKTIVYVLWWLLLVLAAVVAFYIRFYHPSEASIYFSGCLTGVYLIQALDSVACYARALLSKNYAKATRNFFALLTGSGLLVLMLWLFCSHFMGVCTSPP